MEKETEECVPKHKKENVPLFFYRGAIVPFFFFISLNEQNQK